MSERMGGAAVPMTETWATLARTKPIAAAAIVVAVGGDRHHLGRLVLPIRPWAQALPALLRAALSLLFRDPARGAGDPRRLGRLQAQGASRGAWP